MQCSNWDRYSITSSARNRTSGGTVSPNWPAVLRFKINSNRVGDSIGRTAALVPCRIFAAITPLDGIGLEDLARRALAPHCAQNQKTMLWQAVSASGRAQPTDLC